MQTAGVVLLVASGVVVVAAGIGARWRYYGSKEIGVALRRATVVGLAGVIAGLLLVALAR